MQIELIAFAFVEMIIHINTDDQNFVVSNKSDKRRKFIKEADEVYFITDISRTIIVQGLSLNVTPTILGCISSMLFSDFKTRELKNIPSPPVASLTEFFHADTDTNIHQLAGSRYFSSSLL